MSKQKLKKSKAEASERIGSQIEKGRDLWQKGKSLIADKYSHQVPTRARDGFEIKYEQWEDFTAEVLDDLFESSHYGYQFKEKRSSEVEYVGSDWVPDIKYYLEKQLIPKIDYLEILYNNLNEFDEPSNEQTEIVTNRQDALESFTSQTTPIEKLELPNNVTLSWMWEHVPAKFWIWAIGIILAVFALGVTAGQVNWIQDIFVREPSPRVSENRQDNYSQPKLVTISSGEITLPSPGLYLVDTEDGITSDELRRVIGLSEGDQVILSAASNRRTVVLRKGPHLKIQADFYLNSENDRIVLICNGSNVFSELSRASND